ncbi:MAG: cation diffusion facilitator family transporter [Thermoleophilia bacterium]|nr:cation diffusion facilitator family transporter [Thermoleophilia bacterium]
MGHDHRHDAGGAGSGVRRPLAIALALVSGFAVVELVGGLAGGSLALLADAGHMLGDALALALALGAVTIARRPSTPRHSFGLRRAEILAALVNGVTLVALAIWILVEAAGRLADPPPVAGATTLVIAIAGLGVNLAAGRILMRGERTSLNLRAALLHVGADALGSVGVIVAAVLIMTTGWLYADPLVGILIGVLILLSSWRVLKESVDVLLEAAPEGLDADAVGRRMAAHPGVVEVHDLHVWTITSGFPALAAHVTVARDADCHAVRRGLGAMLAGELGIGHTTLQVEHVGGGRRPIAVPGRG